MHLCQGVVIEVTIMSTKEDCLIVDRGGTTSIGKLGHGLKTHVSICVVDFPVQWDIVMDIFGVLLGLVNNDRRHEVLPISSGKYK